MRGREKGIGGKDGAGVFGIFLRVGEEEKKRVL